MRAFPALMAAALTATKAAAIAAPTALQTVPKASNLLDESSASSPASLTSLPKFSASLDVSFISSPMESMALVLLSTSFSILLSSAWALLSFTCHALVLASFSPKDLEALSKAARKTSILLF